MYYIIAVFKQTDINTHTRHETRHYTIANTYQDAVNILTSWINSGLYMKGRISDKKPINAEYVKQA